MARLIRTAQIVLICLCVSTLLYYMERHRDPRCVGDNQPTFCAE